VGQGSDGSFGSGGATSSSLSRGIPSPAAIVSGLKSPKKRTCVTIGAILCLLVAIAVLATLSSYDPVRAMERIEDQEVQVDSKIAADTAAQSKIEAVQEQLKQMREDPSLTPSARRSMKKESKALTVDKNKIARELTKLRAQRKLTQKKLTKVVQQVKKAKVRGGSGYACVTGQCYQTDRYFGGADCPNPGKAGWRNIRSAVECQRKCQTSKCCKAFVFKAQMKTCWAKRAAQTATQRRGWVTGRKCCSACKLAAEATGGPAGCFLNATIIRGGDCKPRVQTTLANCQQRCQSIECCEWFSWDSPRAAAMAASGAFIPPTTRGMCAFKAMAGQKQPPMMSSTSGPKCCK
jgi:hypothetical protein